MQITENVHALRLPFKVTTPTGVVLDRFVNIFLIYTDRVTLIDSGVAETREIIFDYLHQTGREPKEIALLIHTHAHPDHIGASRTVQRVSGCKIAIHEAERDWLENLDLQVSERPVPGFRTLVEGPVAADLLLRDGDLLELGNDLTLKVIHTPGHSKGSISLLLQQQGVLFCGDAVPLPEDMPIYDDVAASLRSMERLRALNNIDWLLSAWDEPRKGSDIHSAFDAGFSYVKQVHEIVMNTMAEAGSDEPNVLCSYVVDSLGLPRTAMNPLVVRTVAAHVASKNLHAVPS